MANFKFSMRFEEMSGPKNEAIVNPSSHFWLEINRQAELIGKSPLLNDIRIPRKWIAYVS